MAFGFQGFVVLGFWGFRLQGLEFRLRVWGWSGLGFRAGRVRGLGCEGPRAWGLWGFTTWAKMRVWVKGGFIGVLSSMFSVAP